MSTLSSHLPTRSSIPWSSFKQKPAIIPFIVTPVHNVDKGTSTTRCRLVTDDSRNILSQPTPIILTEMSDKEPQADLSAIAELFVALRRMVTVLHTTFDKLGPGTNLIAHLAPVLEANQQIEAVRAKLEEQIVKEEKSMQEIRHLLENAIEDKLLERLKAEIYNKIRSTIKVDIQERVCRELEKRIPETLRKDVQAHRREFFEVKTILHNSEARRHNAGLHASMVTEPLRPLLRPLPSALQSPAYISLGPFSGNISTIATPITTTPSTHQLNCPPIEMVPPTPSPLFPRDLNSLFVLGPEAARRLIQDYALDNSPLSQNDNAQRDRPVVNTAGPPSASPIKGSPASGREGDINKFMAYIGAPFLMIPAPKPKLSIETGWSLPHVGARQDWPALVISTSAGY